MERLEISQCVLGAVSTNCYLLKNKDSGELLIVDPADAPEKIIEAAERMGGSPVGILLTHGHYDHILAVNALKEKYDLTVYACEKEKALLGDPRLSLTVYQGGAVVEADVWLSDLEVFFAAGFSIQMLHTPGHTAGSCCYYLKEPGALFSGDTLFCRSVGRSDLPTGSTRELMESVKRLLENLPEEVEVYPGHESMTTIGYEKRYNPFV